jgi:hypothetical protein
VTKEALDFWQFILQQKSWVLPEYIPGPDNIMADYFSRHTPSDHDYGLLPHKQAEVETRFFAPQADLFASPRLHVTSQWVGINWFPDSLYGNAFLLHPWPPYSFLFPPPPLLPRAVSRLAEEGIPFILIAPAPEHALYLSWFPVLATLISLPPLYLGETSRVCRMADGTKVQSSGTKVPLAAYCLHKLGNRTSSTEA